jgi:hypothetical protein
MQVIHAVCCGIDVHAAQLTACLRRVSEEGQSSAELVDYGTTYRELLALRTWLQQQHCCGASTTDHLPGSSRNPYGRAAARSPGGNR